MPDEPIYMLRLTPSQRMALLDVITAVMVSPLQMEVYVDVARNTETTPATLLRLVMDAEPAGADAARLTTAAQLRADANRIEACATQNSLSPEQRANHYRVAAEKRRDADALEREAAPEKDSQ